MAVRFFIAAISMFIMLAACGGGGGSTQPQAGKIILSVDNEGDLTEAQLNCTADGKTYEGTYTPTSVDFPDLGSCTNVAGDADVANCTGSVTATCDGADVTCVLTAVGAQCACENDVGAEFLQEADVVNNLITTAIGDANAGLCQAGADTYTCDC